jgi:hypothetical protein
MKSSLTASLSVFLLGASLAAAQPKAAPTLKSVLLDQLKASHNVQDWYVPASKAVEGMTFEQALWHQGDSHSVAQLVNHLTFWNRQQLAKFKGEKPAAFSGNNEETFTPPKDKASWDAAVKAMDDVLTELEKAVDAADDAKLQSWYATLAHISTHNAYHTGQIVYVRKLQGSWDANKGVKA